MLLLQVVCALLVTRLLPWPGEPVAWRVLGNSLTWCVPELHGGSRFAESPCVVLNRSSRFAPGWEGHVSVRSVYRLSWPSGPVGLGDSNGGSGLVFFVDDPRPEFFRGPCAALLSRAGRSTRG